MKLYNFDLLSYPALPEQSPRTPVPNDYFDPELGARNYREHIDEMAYCEELGFEGIVFKEWRTTPASRFFTFCSLRTLGGQASSSFDDDLLGVSPSFRTRMPETQEARCQSSRLDIG